MTTLFSAEFFDANKGTAYHKALAQFEKPLLKEVLIRCHGNQTKAAEILGLNRGTLRKKLIQHGLHN
ncbi:protein ninH [Acinetobacter sp. C_4_1]|uniref:helix-turn-helix domain-containing protein n=1 Tax=unclassified Acinetobacter TaxID=196816 RepID=UPI0021B77CA3|nr:protein ninH [Acinetobacter sp. F_3_1]MCT8101576.1 protein ninH [Acinetobacter sp. C_4_1]MCT8135089.1 protein ninH [Acinetobacter sp. T_3_1]